MQGWPPRRRRYFLAGIAALTLALATPLAVYGDAFFSAHMVQHLALIFGAAPGIVLGAPVALAMRSSSAPTRRKLSAVVHSRAVAALGHPVVAWVVFAGVMWASHFSPLFDLALENEAVHVLEHSVYLAAALLFWWPVAGVDPGARTLSHPLRVAYLALALPQGSWLGLAIYSSSGVLYPHYATLARSWGPSPLADQRIAGIIMWVGGDLLFVGALALTITVWARHERLEARRIDRRLGSGAPQ